MVEENEKPKTTLYLETALGISGGVIDGCIFWENHLIYPLGSAIVIKNLDTMKQTFLRGHTDEVTCITASKDGKLLASGQKTHSGFRASILLWKLRLPLSETEIPTPLSDFHKGKVQGLSFSPTGKFLASLGGRDCNNLVVWSVETKKAISFTSAASEQALRVFFGNIREDMIITCGYYHLKRWSFSSKSGLSHVDSNLGTIRRVFTSCSLYPDDNAVIAGSSTGDVFLVDLKPKIPILKHAGNEMFSNGVTVLRHLGPGSNINSDDLLLGAGDGSVTRLDATTLKRRTKCNLHLQGAITSMNMSPEKTCYFVTDKSNIYRTTDLFHVDPNENTTLLASCHPYPINDVAFLKGFNAVFLTCSKNDIRIWNAKQMPYQELLRIQVIGATCNCICLPENGSIILSGWDDAKIRGFYPKTGKLAFVMNECHDKGVTAISITNSTVISGGFSGEVRFWDFVKRTMVVSLKEHRQRVNSIDISACQRFCLTSSDDGSCIMWDIQRKTRVQAIFLNTMFKQASYSMDNSQYLAVGTDRKISYFDVEGNLLRELETGQAALTALSLSSLDKHFVIGTDDGMVKIYLYDLGKVVAVACGHSGKVSKVHISPDEQKFVTVGHDNAICVWRYDFHHASAEL